MSSTHGWNQDSLEFAFAQLRALPFTRAMIVRRRGETVAEEYFNDGSETYPNNQRSITKSITSALYGIAIERGLLPSLDVPIAEFLPRAYSRVTDRRKFDIHFRHLITMTAGLDADDNTPAADPSDELDRARFVLNRPMIARPGERYAYYSPYCGLLLQMLESIVKRPALDFANEFLFDPLGIEVGGWYRSPQGFLDGAMFLTARDMAKFGELYLNGGVHHGRRILSPEWIADSFRPHIKTDEPDIYMGYWWFSKLGIGNDYFMARGYGQQYIIVAPERELVLVLACKQEPRSAAEIDALLFLLDQKIMRAAPVSHRGADDSGPTPVLA